MRVIAGRDQSFPFHSFHFQDFVLSKKKEENVFSSPKLQYFYLDVSLSS